jgi:hypothetical protein
MALSPGAIAGIVIGSVVIVLVLIGLLYHCCWSRKSRANETAWAPGAAPDYPLSPTGYPPIHYSSPAHYPSIPGEDFRLELSHTGYSEPPVSQEPVNFGSMQVKGIADVREGRERAY